MLFLAYIKKEGINMENKQKKLEELNGFKDLRIVDNFYQT